MAKYAWKLITIGNSGSGFLPEQSKFRLEYPPNKKVFALPGTPGIFVFVNKEAAGKYLGYSVPPVTLVAVQVHGRPRKPRFIGYSDTLEYLMEHGHDWKRKPLATLRKKVQKLWDNTLCYPAITRLEEKHEQNWKMNGKDLELLMAWRREKPEARRVDIEIRNNCWKNDEEVKIWVYDTDLCVGEHVTCASEINLEKKAEENDRKNYEKFKKRFEEGGENGVQQGVDN